ncbi:MAG: nitrilase [Meiothermus sp.]
MNLILKSPDGRFAVVQSEPWMAEALAEIQAASFPDLAPEERMQPEHYRSQMQIFPQGQHAVLEVATGRVVACSTDLRAKVDFAHFAHQYLEAVGGNYLTTHDPAGDWLYGADIGVHPDYRGLGLSTLLYTARHQLVRELGLQGHVAGAMPKGYGALKHQMPIEVYVQRVIRGEMFDPVLSVQLRRGYAVWGIIPEYLHDPSCANYGVFIVWRNPEVDS